MGLFRGRDINKKTNKDLYYLQSLQVQHDQFLCYHPYFSVSSNSLFLKKERLAKGCRYWIENSGIFTPEAA